MRPFSVLICLFLILSVTFTVVAVFDCDGTIVSICAIGENPDGYKNSSCVARLSAADKDGGVLLVANKATTFGPAAVFALNPGGG